MKIDHTTTTQRMLTTSIQPTADLWTSGRKLTGRRRRRGRIEPLTIGQISMTKEGACQAGDVTVVEAHSSLHIVCTTKMTSIITLKIAHYSWSQREKWIKITHNLHHNP
jgi:hypothetical protein